MNQFLAALSISLVAFSFGCNSPIETAGGEVIKLAPPLILEKLDGSGTLSLSEQKGKVVLVDLWATWCAPCIVEMPHLQTLSENYAPEDFVMLGIVLDSGSPEEINDFLAEQDINYTQLHGQDGTKESFGPFLGYPTKYLIDRENYIVKQYFGVIGDGLSADVESLVQTGMLTRKLAE